MTETDDIVVLLNERAEAAEYRWDEDAFREAAAHITRLEERCAAYKGQVEAGAAEIEQMKIDAGKLRICLNCGRTADAATVKRGDDLPECRGPDGLSGCVFDATPQEAWEFWRQKAHDYMTRAEAAEREVAALKEEGGRLRALVENAQSIFEHCEVTDGVCCCGDDMKAHADPMICGHAPVDHGGYAVDLWLKEAALLPREPKP